MTWAAIGAAAVTVVGGMLTQGGGGGQQQPQGGGGSLLTQAPVQAGGIPALAAPDRQPQFSGGTGATGGVSNKPAPFEMASLMAPGKQPQQIGSGFSYRRL